MVLAQQVNKMKHKLIVFDFEVFKYDVLLGAIVIDDENVDVIQTWDKDKIRQFYYDNVNSIWIGHNNSRYDNFILQTIVKKGNPYITSKEIIEQDRRKYLDIQLFFYDLMSQHFGSLKTIECAFGKNISESEVDFNLDRPLTKEEKEKTEHYNRDDLEQTLDDLEATKGELFLRFDIINEFKLPLDCLHITGTQIAEEVLHAKKIDGIENWVIKPKMYDNLRVQNQEVIDFYLKEKFKIGEKLKVTLCGVEHNIGSGGIHGAKKNKHVDWAYYFDVSGYYNLIMILLDLLPRSIPDEYKAFYKEMYEQQLILKKTNPQKRWVFKVILLSVFGAMTNKFCKFYDPYKGQLVTMVGQMFLVDLLEKLEGNVDLIQSNTDGIIAKPLNGVSEQDLVNIIDEWQNRTGFVLKLEKITDIHQRDVNCYMYRTPDGSIKCLGEAIKYYDGWDNPLWKDSFSSKEPMIMHHCVVDYFMYGKLPEQTIEENKSKLRMFQYICKKLSFDWLEYESFDINTGNVTATPLQNVNRAFALKSDNIRGMVYKRKHVGKTTKAKVSNLPDNVFVYNHEILSDKTVNELMPKIDYDYYVKRAYERILEFVDIPLIKDVSL